MPPKATKTKQKRKYTNSIKNHVQKSLISAKETGTAPALTEEEKTYNDKLITHSLKVFEISQSANTSDPETLKNCFFQYMQLCQMDGFRIGNIGAASALGISYKTLLAWANGYRKQNDERYQKLATLIMSICSTSREQLINEQKINPVIGIFWQRNFDGLRNDTEQQQDAIGAALDNDNNQTANDYMKKYGKLLDE